MLTGVLLVGWAEFLLIGFTLIGGPMLLVDWLRKRRLTEIERQIALTDALDGELGAIFAPVVTKPLLGPWEVHIAVPYLEPAMTGRLLSVVDDVFAGTFGVSSSSYQIFLSVEPDSPRERHALQTTRSTARWAGNPMVSA